MGKNTFRIEVAGMSRSVSIYIKKPTIEDAFWSDASAGGTIKEAFYGDKVKFTIKTKDIPDGTTLDFILYDYDGNYNPDDELDRSFSAKVKNNMAELEFVPDIKWEESAKYEADKVVETYFKIEATIKGKKITAQLPKKEDEYLKIYRKKEIITIIIELPMKNYDYSNMSSLQKIVAKSGLLGHTGIAIGDEYYDYGPEHDLSILKGKILESKYGDLNADGDTTDIYKGISDSDLANSGLNQKEFGDPTGTLGSPWWDKGNIDLKDLAAILNDDSKRAASGIKGETYIFELDVTKKEAKVVKDWWDNKYNSDLGMYSVDITEDGNHCTSTVRDSLIAAKIIRRKYSICTPSSLLADIIHVEHSAGKERGKKIRKRVLKDIS